MNHRSALDRRRCTWLGGSGRLCGRPSFEGSPFAICADHADKFYDYMLENFPPRDPTEAERKLEHIEQTLASGRAARERFDAAKKASEQVYYVRIHDYVKIGYTCNVRQRMSQLRIDDPDAVLATEPGGQKLERQRHLQFAADRIGRRENFTPSPALMAHIERVVAEHGEPSFDKWPRAAA